MAGISFILQSQNDDGGIAIANLGDKESGIWTTAECLDAIVSSKYSNSDMLTLEKILEMVQYLNNHFVGRENETGFWNLSENGIPSTVTTGHVIHALNKVKNNILNVVDLESISVSFKDKKFDNYEIQKIIDSNNEKAVKWLFANQRTGGGWSDTEKDRNHESEIFCVYYVLKGLISMGNTAENNKKVSEACGFVVERINKIFQNKQESESDLPNVLYGYSCLVSSGYFKKKHAQIRKKIIKYIKEKWKQINKKEKSKMSSIQHKGLPFVFNMPYIALDALLVAEEYNSFNKKIEELTNSLVEQQEGGAWKIQKKNNENKLMYESTWVTAEAIIILDHAEQWFSAYQRDIIQPKKQRSLVMITMISAVINSLLVLYLFKSSSFSVESIFNILGNISSILTILLATITGISYYFGGGKNEF